MLTGKGPDMGLGALICGRCRLDLLRRVNPRPSMVSCEKGERLQGRRRRRRKMGKLGMTGSGIAFGHRHGLCQSAVMIL